MSSKDPINQFYSTVTVDQHLDKRYTFSNSEFKLCNQELNSNLSEDEFERRLLSVEEWKVDDLTLIEENVFRVKSKLNHYIPASWSAHTNKFCLLNIYDCYSSFKESPDELTSQVEQIYQQKPELFTRAWIKLHEILVKFNIKDVVLNEINCLFLCEAPGAFVTSLNHYIKQSSPECTLNWLASSLNPYFEGNDCYKDALTEDCFIEQTFERWYFGEDNSGDIEQPNFSQLMKAEFDRSLGRSSKVDLVTGDGGIRNIETPEFQEINSLNLIMNEAIVGLNCLSNGGCLILKIFSFFNCKTISLIYLLVNVFKNVHLIKPISSKEGNSEIYLVCMNYQLNENSQLIEQIARRFKKSKNLPKEMLNVILFKKEKIPAKFLDKLIECANMFAQHQTNSIERNIYLFEKNDRNFYFKYKKLQNKINSRFKQLMQLKPIKIEDQVVKKVNQIHFKKNYYYFGLDKKALLAYGTQMSYEEMIAERNDPEKKLTKIRLLIASSVYLKPKKELFGHFDKFYQFDHSTTIVLNHEKFIEQTKNIKVKQYSNSKLCCENLIKLSTDYDLLSEPIRIDAALLNKTLRQNEQTILNQFENLFSTKSESATFNIIDHVRADNEQSLLSILMKTIKSLKQNVKQHESALQLNETDTVLHLIDLFNAIDTAIYADEHCLINFLVLKLSEIIDQLKYNHLLVIALPSLYSRYALCLIFLCTCIYKQFTISPFYLRSNDLKSGLIFVFANGFTSSNVQINNDFHMEKSFRDDIEIDNNMETGDSPLLLSNLKSGLDSTFSENDFRQEHSQFKNRILDCHKLITEGRQILDMIGIHRLMREKKYIDFLKLIILANNLHLIETLRLKIDLSLTL